MKGKRAKEGIPVPKNRGKVYKMPFQKGRKGVCKRLENQEWIGVFAVLYDTVVVGCWFIG